MRAITEKEKLYYQETWSKRRLNKRAYILKFGLLFFALPAYLITYAINHYIHIQTGINLHEFIIGLLCWAAGGLIYGYWMFSISEKRYKQIIDQ